MRVGIFGGGISIFWSCLVELHEKKVDLSRNSYLNSEINVCIFNLVIVKIFNGFFVLNLIKHFDILN